MKHTQWNISPCSRPALEALEAAGVSPLVARVLCARGLSTPQQAQSMLSGPADLADPFLMRDMARAAARVRQALDGGERIAVYGDYDVDGITSTCLLTSFLFSRGAREVIPYIPDRLEEGYGLNCDAISALAARGVTLLITVDCGITAVEEAAWAASLGVDVVITDHHECQDTLPAAIAVLNPHRPDCTYPFPHLAGVGVALKLALALTPPEQRRQALMEYADLAAIGTVADVVQLTGENRTIVQLGLRALASPRRPGLVALLREAGLEDRPLTASSISFSLAPRINAAGRMGHAALAAELLLTGDPLRCASLAQALCELNQQRQAIELDIYTQCLELLGDGPHSAIVLASERWHQGVVGIVASRLAEKYGCPTFMICLQGGVGKGSCRSCGGFNLFAALERSAPLLEKFGGHALAAGFTIREENIPAFRAEMIRQVSQAVQADESLLSYPLTVDAELSDPGLLTMEHVADLARLEPFGSGNPQPVFLLSGLTVASLAGVGAGRHSRLRLTRGWHSFDAILFSTPPQALGLKAGDRVDAAFFPQINEFRGRRDVQLLLCDLRPALSHAQADRQLYDRYRQGAPLTPEEASAILPSREDFAALWRYLQSASGGSRVEDTAPRLCRKVARSTGARETYTRTMICLEVFQERGLISLCTQTDHLRIDLRPVEKKVNLDESCILQRLRALAEV